MLSIYSHYKDENFNKHLYKLCISTLNKKIKLYDCTYNFNNKTYNTNDVLNTLTLNNNKIYYRDRSLINYIVYDLSQKFWLEQLNIINNMLGKLYLEYRRDYDKFISEQKRTKLNAKDD